MAPSRVVGPRAANFVTSLLKSLDKRLRSGTGSLVVAFAGHALWVSHMVSERGKGQQLRSGGQLVGGGAAKATCRQEEWRGT
jgi:hypothetical protein